MTPLFRWVMFFSSYIPLLLVLCVLLIDRQPVWMLNVFSFTHIVSWASTCIFFFTILLFALMMSYYFIVLKRRPGELRVVESIQARDSDTLSYIATYLLPFVVFPLDTKRQIISLIIVVFVLGFVYISSNMIYINPILNMLGFHLYELTLKEEKIPHILISRRKTGFEHPEEITLVGVYGDVFLERQ
jgi:hypothetical protein